MKRVVLVGCLLAGFVAMPRPAFAWGAAAHRMIMGRALDILPAPLKAFLEHFRPEVVLRVNDPDQWRVVGWEDDPNHFLDFGAPEFGPYPFDALPRDYTAALEKFGRPVLERNGLMPWREAEMFGNLRRGFAGFARREPYATSNTVLFTAVVSHYIQDATQPFHATDNFDGQKTGNNGIHSRFERDLFERYESRLKLSPAPPSPVVNPRDYSFDTLLASHPLVEAVLQADKAAAAGKEFYDDDYYEKFFTAVQPTLERQLSQAITATASMILGAWEQAGRPVLATSDARPPQRVRR